MADITNVQQANGSYTAYAPGYAPGDTPANTPQAFANLSDNAQSPKNPVIPPAPASPPPQPTHTPTVDNTPPSEPVVLSSSNITDSVIPENTAALANLSAKGSTNDETGLLKNSDGTYATAPSTATQNEDGTWSAGGHSYGVGPDTGTVDPQTQQINNRINNLITQTDAQTAAQISNIKQVYTALLQQQQQSNASQEAGRSASLLVGGTSRYDTPTSTSIMGLQIDAGLAAIAKIEADENNAIAAAQAAGQKGDMALQDKLIQGAQTLRDSKQAAAQKLQDMLSTAHATVVKQQQQSAIDESIAHVFASGTTDPAAILDSLQKQGVTTATAEDVANVLKTINGSGAYKFSTADTARLLGAGITAGQIQALREYYSGTGTSAALGNLTADQQAMVHDVLNGTAAKKASSTVPTYAQLHPKTPSGKGYTSGSLSYASSDLGSLQTWLGATKGSDGYVDPNAYQQAFDSWVAKGGLAKDFLKNFPPKSYINPANDWLPNYLKSRTSTKITSDIASQINALTLPKSDK